MGSQESSLIAVDVALVPPERIQERGRRINQELADGGLVLDATHVPHITLAQCFAWRSSLPLLIERLDLVLRRARLVPISGIA